MKDAGYFTFNSGKDDYNFHYNRQALYDVGNEEDYKPGMNGWQGNHAIDYMTVTDYVWNTRKDKNQPWFDIADYVANAGDWRAGFNTLPSIIDGGGEVFTLDADVTIPKGLKFQNMVLQFDGAQLTLGDDASGTSNTNSWIFDGFEGVWVGDTDYAKAMIYLPKSSHSVFTQTCKINAGTGSARARYGVYAGRYYAYGCYFGGSYRGGDCSIRVGREQDQTSNVFAPLICARSRVVNALFCNPKGLAINGNIEHSEDGGLALAITSQTNGSSSIAEAIEISAGYAFENSDGSASSDGKKAVTIGHDLPNSEGWDQAGVITSGTGAQCIYIHDMYMRTNYVETFFQIAAFGLMEIKRINWGGTPTGSNPQKLAEFSGTCTDIEINQCRNTTTGAISPVFSSTGTNPIMISLQMGTNTPSLYGNTTAGTFTYSDLQGRRTVNRNMVTQMVNIAWSAKSGATGDARISIPSSLMPITGWTATVAVTATGCNGAVEGKIFPGTNIIILTKAGTTTPVDASTDLQSSGSIRCAVTFYQDFKS